VEEFLVRIDAAIREADKEERAALRSLRGGAEDLRNESIGSAVRRLAAPIAITWPGWDGSTTQLVTKATRREATWYMAAKQRMISVSLEGH